jgi:hypothetical protein
LGRWTAADPLGIVDGFNLYVYSNNNPINLSDASGTQCTPQDNCVHPDDYLDGGAPEMPPPPVINNDGEDATWLKTKEEAKANADVLIEGGAASQRRATEGFVATGGGKKEIEYMKREIGKGAVSGVSNSVLHTPIGVGLFWYGLVRQDFTLANAFATKTAGNSRLSQDVSGLTTLVVDTMFTELLTAKLKIPQIQATTDARPDVSSKPIPQVKARFTVTTEGGRPTISFGKNAPDLGYKNNATSQPVPTFALPESTGSKTVSSAPDSPIYTSGWGRGSEIGDYNPAVANWRFNQEYGTPFTPHIFDAKGAPGSYYASHAEAQQVYTQPGIDFLEVSKKECPSCMSRISLSATLWDLPIVVLSPRGFSWYLPNGTIIR